MFNYLGGEHIDFSVYNNELVAFMDGQLLPPRRRSVYGYISVQG